MSLKPELQTATLLYAGSQRFGTIMPRGALRTVVYGKPIPFVILRLFFVQTGSK